MKLQFPFVCLCLLVLPMFISPGHAASSSGERLEIIDQVYERSENNSYIQVGDYGITRVENVWLGTTNGELESIPLRRIKTGSRVKVKIVQENGEWVAENLYLLAEPTETAESAEESQSTGGGEVYLENGTWKN